MYLHHILNRNKNELIRKVYEAQKSDPIKNDWVLLIQSDLQDLDIDIEEFKQFKKARAKKELHKIILSKSFQYLQNIYIKQSKLKYLSYNKLETQKYLVSSKFTDENKALLLRLRTRMIDVTDNFKNKYINTDLLCALKCGEYEDQQHLLDCQVLIDNCEALYDDSIVQYKDLFSSEAKQLDATKLYCKVLETREKLINDITTRDKNLVQCTV